MSSPRTRFAGPLEGALPVDWQSQFHGSRWDFHSAFASLITPGEARGF